jgi:hypothetical protein
LLRTFESESEENCPIIKIGKRSNINSNFFNIVLMFANGFTKLSFYVVYMLLYILLFCALLNKIKLSNKGEQEILYINLKYFYEWKTNDNTTLRLKTF